MEASIPRIIGIMATTTDGTIGKLNGLPWDYPSELEHFRQTTDGHIMVVGRKTFESTPASLFKQKPIVFSKNKQILKTDSTLKEFTIVSSISEFLAHLNKLQCHKVFMIGGAEIAEVFLKNNLISEFILTKIHKNYTGDVRMDLSYFKQWQQILLTKTNDYSIYKLTNPKGENNELHRNT